MTGIARSIQNAIRVRRENLGPTGSTPFTVWIPTPVDEIVSALPLSPESGYRVIWEVPVEASGSPSGSASGSASAASGSPSGSASASASASDTPAADNRIYEWNGETWQVDPLTDPLTDGLAVTVITSPNGSNRIYIYSQAQDEWIDRTADVTIEDGRFYTTWTNGKRYAYPTTASSVLELTQAGMYVVSDFLEDMPLFPGGISEVGDKSLVETIAYNADNAVLRLYHLRTGKNYTRSKVGGTWGEWIEQAEAYPLPNEILSTMGVVWSGEGYIFQALYTRYRFDQQIWIANGGEMQIIELDAADETYNRFDTFVVNNQGEWEILKGDADPDPIVKMPDPSFQLYVTHVLVTANTAEPPSIPQGLMYDEADPGEWTADNSGGTLDAEATVKPERGTKHISYTSLTNGNALTLAAESTQNLSTYETLRFGTHLLEAMTNQHRLFVAFLTGESLASDEIEVPLNRTNTTAYQIVAITLAQFNFRTATPQADALRLRWTKSGPNTTHAGFYLDYVKLEGGIVQPVTPTEHESLLGRDKPSQHPATSISVDSAAFNKNLSSADDTVQKALATLDQMESGGGGGHTILDGEATALTQRDDLQITGGAEVTDDSVNERTVIAVHARQHSILSTDDHQADVANAGKILGFAETTGEPAAFETEEYEGTRNHYVQNTVPTIASAAEGDTWTNPDTARSFELFVDGALKYWIEITPNKITT